MHNHSSESNQSPLSNLKLTEVENRLLKLLTLGECSIDDLNKNLEIPMQLLLSSLMKLATVLVIPEKHGS